MRPGPVGTLHQLERSLRKVRSESTGLFVQNQLDTALALLTQLVDDVDSAAARLVAENTDLEDVLESSRQMLEQAAVKFDVQADRGKCEDLHLSALEARNAELKQAIRELFDLCADVEESGMAAGQVATSVRNRALNVLVAHHKVGADLAGYDRA